MASIKECGDCQFFWIFFYKKMYWRCTVPSADCGKFVVGGHGGRGSRQLRFHQLLFFLPFSTKQKKKLICLTMIEEDSLLPIHGFCE